MRPTTTMFAGFSNSLSAFVVCLLACNVIASNQALGADAAQLTATYGRGVHAYFGGQASQADALLTQVAQAGSSDPRVYYFRAMARMKLGRTYEAENDMRIGATFEARNPGFGSTISKSLQRVQGTHRRTLEKFRRQARLDQLGEQQQKSQLRYETLRTRESDVLRRKANVTLEELAQPGTGTNVPSTGPVLPTTPSPTDVDPVVAAPAEEQADPFGEPTPAVSAEPEPVDDPFGDAIEPEGSEPAESNEFFEGPEPAADDNEDPFAASLPTTNAPSGLEASNSEGLTDDDRVEPGRLGGILGRVAGSMMPWNGVEVPAIPLPGPAGAGEEFSPAGEIEFGPIENDSEFTPAGATEDNPFSDAAGAEPEPEPSEPESDFEEAEPAEDFADPFSDF